MFNFRVSIEHKSDIMATVRKVFTCTFIGRGIAGAPSVVYVPSENSGGMPRREEIQAALEKMGYDKDKARTLSGGGTGSWKCE